MNRAHLATEHSLVQGVCELNDATERRLHGEPEHRIDWPGCSFGVLTVKPSDVAQIGEKNIPDYTGVPPAQSTPGDIPEKTGVGV